VRLVMVSIAGPSFSSRGENRLRTGRRRHPQAGKMSVQGLHGRDFIIASTFNHY